MRWKMRAQRRAGEQHRRAGIRQQIAHLGVRHSARRRGDDRS
jgi:hypothetical protein